jgi:hypothetical protein
LLAHTWRVVDGPEWAASVNEVDPHDGYFARNLEALKIWLERDPHYRTHTFLDGDESLRVYKTKDEAAGYRLLVVIECNDEEKIVERRWLALELL